MRKLTRMCQVILKKSLPPATSSKVIVDCQKTYKCTMMVIKQTRISKTRRSRCSGVRKKRDPTLKLNTIPTIKTTKSTKAIKPTITNGQTITIKSNKKWLGRLPQKMMTTKMRCTRALMGWVIGISIWLRHRCKWCHLRSNLSRHESQTRAPVTPSSIPTAHRTSTKSRHLKNWSNVTLYQVNLVETAR